MEASEKSVIVLLLVVILAQPPTLGIIYGPSLEFLTSTTASSPGGAVGGAELPLPRKTIRLVDYAPNYSVVVPLAVNKSMAEPRFVRPVGEFTVEAPENMRIMAVIQTLHLRTKSVTSAFPPVCRDYILFGDDSINKICGIVQKNDRKGAPNGIMGERTHFSPGSVLNVTIFTAESTFVEDWMMTLNVVEISFTAYQECSESDGALINCLDSVSPYGPSCIPANLSCDGYVNCGFLTEGNFGKDEGNCPSLVHSHPSASAALPQEKSVPTTIPPLTVSSSTHRGVSTPKTGFPSWWENWRKMSNERAKLLNLDLQYGNNKLGGEKLHDQVEIHTRFFEPELRNNSGYFNSFVLYTLCFFVGVSGVSVLLKMLTRYCGDPKPARDGGSSLMHDSATTSVSVIIDGDPSVLSRSMPVCTAMEICECDPPPPYESLFPNENNVQSPDISGRDEASNLNADNATTPSRNDLQ